VGDTRNSERILFRALLRLVFDTAALRRIVRPACGMFVELIYFADDCPSYEINH
jgi:hypothetical protein